jgi:capsid assembly protease
MTQIHPSRSLPHVRAALCGAPWMIQEHWLEAMAEIVERHVAGDKVVYDESGDKIAYEIVSGVGIIPLMGPIFPRANMLTRMSGATSTEEFCNNFKNAMDDEDVEAILLRIDSPGGATSGIFEAADLVYNSRGQGKDIVSLAEGTEASAAYLIGSQADCNYATTASAVGSIGVVAQIADDTRQKQNSGIDVTTIKTGKLKAIGAGPVTDEQKAELNAMIQDMFGRFKGCVMRARTGIDIEKVSTGAMWIGSKAEDMGLIDGITTLENIVEGLSAGNAVRDLMG